MTEEQAEYTVGFRRFDCLQNSEEWDELRRGRPTTSEFKRIMTATKCQYAAGAIDYACELVSQRLGTYHEPPPSFWMEWGKEHEEAAVLAYETKTGLETEKVGFIMPTFTDAYGGSPDRLISDVGILEVKCPAPHTLIRWRHEKKLPIEHKTQLQGLLWITGYEWATFWAWHPELKPFQVTVERDEKYISRLAECMELFLVDLASVAADNELQELEGAEVIYGD